MFTILFSVYTIAHAALLFWSIRLWCRANAPGGAHHRDARSASMLSKARYDGGVTSYLEVLESDRSLFRAELAESSVRREELRAYVDLYKALGGGWH